MSLRTGTGADQEALTEARATVRAVRRGDRRRTTLTAGALALAVLVMFFVDVLLGSYTVTIPDFFRILLGETIPGASFIVMEDKLPRAVIAVLVGASFGISGTIFQTMLRNPLASPDVIGVTAGASASAVFAVVVLGATGTTVSLAAFVGTCAVALAIHVLSRSGGLGGQRLVLVGIGIAAVLQAVTSFLLTRTSIQSASDVVRWLNGSLNNSSWDRAAPLAIALVVLLPAAVLGARYLTGLALGDDTAAGLGVPVARARLLLLLIGVALAAVATAAAGPVAFVAFLAGPIARRLLGGRVALPVAAAVGALIVLTGDYVAANLLPGAAVPVGVVTGALGAPFLLYLLITANRVGRGG
ncbi:iron ABC transporter permease [Rhodococcus sp. X156]|uniref:FecCD family ABC transporter permease n=1 Tax=Rhodococcus sp. X156 TaxID=2499145 RepID=UPI0019D06CB5|nr:iron ABC transporter permease [Rhodococcus sp. X156]